MENQKKLKNLERILKGVANHRRLAVLELLARRPELSVADIADELGMEYVNASDHIRKLAIAGLVWKRHDGPYVRHKLCPRAETILAFCKKLK
jgi:DNA-binding MarR family transcriptional regulator